MLLAAFLVVVIHQAGDFLMQGSLQVPLLDLHQLLHALARATRRSLGVAVLQHSQATVAGVQNGGRAVVVVGVVAAIAAAAAATSTVMPAWLMHVRAAAPVPNATAAAAVAAAATASRTAEAPRVPSRFAAPAAAATTVGRAVRRPSRSPARRGRG